MCQFFSLVSDPQAQKIMYCDWVVRKQILDKKLSFEPDSHTAIAACCGYNAKQEDTLNKYEYNPLTKVFIVDRIDNEIDDSASVEKYCNELDFAKIVPALNVKPIIHPFKINPPKKITKQHLDWLKEWASIIDSVRASVGASVRASVRASMRASVGASVRASVEASVWDSVGASMRASVGASVWDSVRASVWVYTGSFFLLKKRNSYPYQCLVELWNTGLVPSFDGKIWQLHGGKKAKILWEGKP